jgi:hypothetical protein
MVEMQVDEMDGGKLIYISVKVELYCGSLIGALIWCQTYLQLVVGHIQSL